MAISTYADLQSKAAAPHQRIQVAKSSANTVAGRWYSLFVWPGSETGVAPSTAATCDRTTAGAIPIFNGASSLRVVRAQVANTNERPVSMILCDRLSHQGGLSATTTTAQTTNLPTAALTRSTDGVGVMAMLEIYSTLGTTAAGVGISYTNSDGTAGRTTPDISIGSTGFREGARALLVPLAAGDKGVRSVESVTVTTTTGTTGNFGVTLFKPLMSFPYATNNGHPQTFDALLGGGGNLPVIPTDACLFWLCLPYTTGLGNISAELCFSED